MNMSFRRVAVLTGIALAIVYGQTIAAEISIKAVMVPKEQIRLDFADGSKHFVLAVRREGNAEGDGPFAGTSVVEHGWHDIEPAAGGGNPVHGEFIVHAAIGA